MLSVMGDVTGFSAFQPTIAAFHRPKAVVVYFWVLPCQRRQSRTNPIVGISARGRLMRSSPNSTTLAAPSTLFFVWRREQGHGLDANVGFSGPLVWPKQKGLFGASARQYGTPW